jgi:hypothetical protein
LEYAPQNGGGSDKRNFGKSQGVEKYSKRLLGFGGLGLGQVQNHLSHQGPGPLTILCDGNEYKTQT